MSTNPNEIKSQSELNDCNSGKRKSDVLLASIDELEKVKKENEELKKELEYMYDRENVYVTKFNIALDCVLEYSVRNNWKTTELGDSCYFGSNGYELAEETIDKLKKIKNVDIGKCERLQKQLDIAVNLLKEIKAKIKTVYDIDLRRFEITGVFYSYFVEEIDYKIKELNK